MKPIEMVQFRNNTWFEYVMKNRIENRSALGLTDWKWICTHINGEFVDVVEFSSEPASQKEPIM